MTDEARVLAVYQLPTQWRARFNSPYVSTDEAYGYNRAAKDLDIALADVRALEAERDALKVNCQQDANRLRDRIAEHEAVMAEQRKRLQWFGVRCSYYADQTTNLEQEVVAYSDRLVTAQVRIAAQEAEIRRLRAALREPEK